MPDEIRSRLAVGSLFLLSHRTPGGHPRRSEHRVDEIEKSIDSATTALLATLATNDEVVEANCRCGGAEASRKPISPSCSKGPGSPALEHGFDAAGGTLRR